MVVGTPTQLEKVPEIVSLSYCLFSYRYAGSKRLRFILMSSRPRRTLHSLGFFSPVFSQVFSMSTAYVESRAGGEGEGGADEARCTCGRGGREGKGKNKKKPVLTRAGTHGTSWVSSGA